MAPANTRKLDLDDVNDVEDAQFDDEAFDQDVDFEKITDTVPRGEYLLLNEHQELKLSKTSGQPMVSLRIRVISGEHEGRVIFQDFSWSKKAQPRSKKAFVGMGLPAGFQGSLRQMAAELEGLEYYGVIDIEQSDGINERTNRPYDPRNRLVSTSETPQMDV